jgi:hypothetical protein
MCDLGVSNSQSSHGATSLGCVFFAALENGGSLAAAGEREDDAGDESLPREEPRKTDDDPPMASTLQRVRLCVVFFWMRHESAAT